MWREIPNDRLTLADVPEAGAPYEDAISEFALSYYCHTNEGSVNGEHDPNHPPLRADLDSLRAWLFSQQRSIRGGWGSLEFGPDDDPITLAPIRQAVEAIRLRVAARELQDNSISGEESRASDFYVYVYIDPRNFQEFYFGKGRGSRKDAHLTDSSDSEKAQRIAAIKAAGLEPIVRVVARDLTEHDALLVEKTLLWKLGRTLTNISSGHYAENFRPRDTLHVKLSGFDYQNGIYYYNVGEGPHRHWDDYRELGFISAGKAKRFRQAMLGFQPGDVVTAYLRGRGFVGIGTVLERARPIREVMIDGKPLLNHELRPERVAEHSDSDELSEYVCTVEWAVAVERKRAKWKPKSGLFTTTHVRASLDNQPETVKFLEKEFDLSLHDLIA